MTDAHDDPMDLGEATDCLRQGKPEALSFADARAIAEHLDALDNKLFTLSQAEHAELVSHLAPCVFHDHDHAACQGYSGQVPCMTQTESDWLAEQERERDALKLQAQAGEDLGVELLKVEGREQALQAALDRLIDAAATYADIVDRGERPPEAVVDELGRALIDAPEVSLAHLKAQWLRELLDNVKSRDLHTNNGDIRHDAAQRAGWNDCLDELRRRAEGLCEDEGCPQHGTDHVCINRQAKEPPPMSYQQREAWCLMQYQCEACQHLELIWNSRNAVTPFCVACGLPGCDGMKQHTNWGSDTPMLSLPALAARVFVSITREDARALAEQKYDRIAARDDWPLPDQPKDLTLAEWAEHIYGDGHQPYAVPRSEYLRRS